MSIDATHTVDKMLDQYVKQNFRHSVHKLLGLGYKSFLLEQLEKMMRTAVVNAGAPDLLYLSSTSLGNYDARIGSTMVKGARSQETGENDGEQ